MRLLQCQRRRGAPLPDLVVAVHQPAHFKSLEMQRHLESSQFVGRQRREIAVRILKPLQARPAAAGNKYFAKLNYLRADLTVHETAFGQDRLPESQRKPWDSSLRNLCVLSASARNSKLDPLVTVSG